MIEMLGRSSSKLRIFFQQIRGFDVIGVIFALLIFVLILLNIFPDIFRSISLKAREGYAEFIPFFILLLYIAFCLPGPWSRFLSIILTFSFFGLALAGLWQSGQSQSTVFNGIVPLFDASDYYTDALRLIAGQSFSSFSARRPLFPGLLAVLLTLTGRNLMASLGILTAITAGACYLAAKEIQRTHGAEAAVLVLTILFLFYRYNNGLVMSESLGITLGALGFVFIWRGLADFKQSSVWVGLFITTLALSARAGAFFTLPLMLLWGGWVFRMPGKKFSWIFFLGGLGAVSGGFLLNWLLYQLLATPSGVLFANFSYTLYGLASGGKSWSYIFVIHPELLNLSEPYQSNTIYLLALEQIRQHPSLLLHGMLYNWKMFFSYSYGAYTYVFGEHRTVNIVVQWGLFILCAAGIYKWLNSKFADVFSSFVGLSALGIFISVPFLPPTDAFLMRPYAASIIFFGLLPAIGLIFILEKLKPGARFFFLKDRVFPSYEMTTLLSIGLLMALTIGPYLVKLTGNTPVLPMASCDAEFVSIVTRFNPGTYFNVIPDDNSKPDGMPNFHLQVLSATLTTLLIQNLTAWAFRAKPPVSMFYALDYRTSGKALISIPSSLLPKPGVLMEICGDWDTVSNLREYNIFYAKSAKVISPLTQFINRLRT